MKNLIQKAFAAVESVDDDKFGPNGGFTAVLSTPSEDRDFEELKRSEWIEPLQDRYPFDMDHGMTVSDTVGSYRPYFDGDRIIMDTYWASTPKAQEARALVNEGHIRNVSVAFMTHKTKKGNSEPFREMLNAGLVAIPSNRDAVILASKAASCLKDAFDNATDDEDLAEVKAAVLKALEPKSDDKPSGVFIDVHARLDEESVKAIRAQVDEIAEEMTQRFSKAAQTASGVGGDGALVQAIHDASSHLGAACPVIEVPVDPDSGASSGANKSVEDTETNLDAFTKGLEEILPEDSPAEAAAASSDEEPAPADDAAEVRAKRNRELQTQIRLNTIQ